MEFDAQFLLSWLAMMSVGIVVAFICITVVGYRAFKNGDSSAEKFVDLFVRGEFVRLITAITIVIGTIALSFGKVISGEVAGTLLGSIAGYVLGGMSRTRRNQNKEDKDKKA